MPHENLAPIQAKWLEFLDATFPLFVPDLDDSGLYQYLQFRDNLFALLKSDAFLNALGEAWTIPTQNTEKGSNLITSDQMQQVLNLALLEVQAITNGLRAESAPAEKEKKKGWLRKWLGRAGSVAGSLKELPEKLKLPWYAESGLIAFKELVEAFEKR